MEHDDGARLFVDNLTTPKINVWETCCQWEYADVQLAAGNHTIRVEMHEDGGAANIKVFWEPTTINRWRGEYYNNPSLSGNPSMVRDDSAINFNWADGSPGPLIYADHFSARWSDDVNFTAGNYKFSIFHDDGAHLMIDGQTVFDNWCESCQLTETVTVPIGSGTNNVVLEMFENLGSAGVQLTWAVENNPIPELTAITPVGVLNGNVAFV